MKKDELLFTLEKEDYKLIFEYETQEDLKDILKINNLLKDNSKEIKRIENTNRLLKNESTKQLERINFYKLETLFINAIKEKAKKKNIVIKETTYTKYAQTFTDLKKFFDTEEIDNITQARFEDFKNSFLKRGLKNNTCNEKIMYTNVFLNYALENNLIKENKVSKIEKFAEDEVEKELFTKQDLKNIFNSTKIKDEDKKIFKILLYSGMRINEVYNLTKENLKTNDDDIKYISLKVTKFDKKRVIPIHKEIEELLYNFDFENLRKKWKKTRFANYFNEQIFKVIPKSQRKTNHTFRANFVNKLINNFPNQIHLIQLVVGHKIEEKANLTIKKYGKDFDLKNKKILVDSLKFDLN